MFILNLILPVFKKIIRYDLRKLTIGVFVIGFLLASYQIKTRDYDFAYTGYTSRYAEYEKRSKEIQQKILGDKLYKFMEGFDNKLNFHF